MIQNKCRGSAECNTNFGAAAVSNRHQDSVEYRLKSVNASPVVAGISLLWGHKDWKPRDTVFTSLDTKYNKPHLI